MKNIYIKINLLLMMFTLAVFSNGAMAQSVAIDAKAPSSLGELKVADNDASLTVMRSLFGGLLEGTGSDDAANNPLVNAIATFNVCVLLIGGILAAYTILAGVIGTAYDGKMLGQQFSSAWLPIRYTIGVALILPVVGKGYAIIQLIVMWLIVRGVAVADNVWLSYVEGNIASIKEQVISPTLMNTSEYQKNVLNLFSTSVCYKTLTSNMQTSAELLGQPRVAPIGDQWVSKGKANGFSAISESAVKNNGYGKSHVDFKCGRISYKEDVVLKSGSNGAPSDQATGRFANLTNVMGSDVDLSPVNKYHQIAIDETRRKVDIYADKVLAEGLLDTQAGTVAVATELAKLTEEYKQSVSTQIMGSTVLDNVGTSMIESAKSNGWFLAGTWFLKFVHLNEAVSRAANNIPLTETYTHFYGANSGEALSGGLEIDKSRGTKNAARQAGGASSGEIKKLPNLTGLRLDNPSLSIAPAIQVERNGNGVVVKDQTENTDGGSIMQNLMLKLGKMMTGIDLKELKNNRTNVIVILGDIGNQLMVSAGALMGGGLAISGVAMLVPGIGGMLSIFGAFMAPLAATLWATAFTSAYMIPMMPFMLWIGAIIGWVVLVVEAIIAAPLWAVMHLHPDGNNMYGRGGNGYSLVLALLLRPVLLVFGFIAAIAITQIMGEFINRIFYDVLINSVSGSTGDGMSFVAILFGLLIYISLLTTFVSKMFGVTTMIADNLLKWMGGQTEQLGSFAGEFGQAGQKASGEMTQFAHSATMGLSRSAEKFGHTARGLMTGGLSGAAGGVASSSWANQDGGFEALDSGQQAEATKAFDAWKGVNENSDWDVGQYVDYVQEQRRKKNGVGGGISDIYKSDIKGLMTGNGSSTTSSPDNSAPVSTFSPGQLYSGEGITNPVDGSATANQGPTYKENDGPQIPNWRDTNIKYENMMPAMQQEVNANHKKWLENNNATRLAQGKTAKLSMTAPEYVSYVQGKAAEQRESSVAPSFSGSAEVNRASDWRNTNTPYEELPQAQQAHANKIYSDYVARKTANEQRDSFGNVEKYMAYVRKKNDEAPEIDIKGLIK